MIFLKPSHYLHQTKDSIYSIGNVKYVDKERLTMRYCKRQGESVTGHNIERCSCPGEFLELC